MKKKNLFLMFLVTLISTLLSRDVAWGAVCAPGEVDMLEYFNPQTNHANYIQDGEIFYNVASPPKMGKSAFYIVKNESGDIYEEFAYDSDYIYHLKDTSWATGNNQNVKCKASDDSIVDAGFTLVNSSSNVSCSNFDINNYKPAPWVKRCMRPGEIMTSTHAAVGFAKDGSCTCCDTQYTFGGTPVDFTNVTTFKMKLVAIHDNFATPGTAGTLSNVAELRILEGNGAGEIFYLSREHGWIGFVRCEPGFTNCHESNLVDHFGPKPNPSIQACVSKPGEPLPTGACGSPLGYQPVSLPGEIMKFDFTAKGAKIYTHDKDTGLDIPDATKIAAIISLQPGTSTQTEYPHENIHKPIDFQLGYVDEQTEKSLNPGYWLRALEPKTTVEEYKTAGIQSTLPRQPNEDPASFQARVFQTEKSTFESPLFLGCIQEKSKPIGVAFYFEGKFDYDAPETLRNVAREAQILSDRLVSTPNRTIYNEKNPNSIPLTYTDKINSLKNLAYNHDTQTQNMPTAQQKTTVKDITSPASAIAQEPSEQNSDKWPTLTVGMEPNNCTEINSGNAVVCDVNYNFCKIKGTECSIHHAWHGVWLGGIETGIGNKIYGSATAPLGNVCLSPGDGKDIRIGQPGLPIFRAIKIQKNSCVNFNFMVSGERGGAPQCSVAATLSPKVLTKTCQLCYDDKDGDGKAEVNTDCYADLQDMGPVVCSDCPSWAVSCDEGDGVNLPTEYECVNGKCTSSPSEVNEEKKVDKSNCLVGCFSHIGEDEFHLSDCLAACFPNLSKSFDLYVQPVSFVNKYGEIPNNTSDLLNRIALIPGQNDDVFDPENGKELTPFTLTFENTTGTFSPSQQTALSNIRFFRYSDTMRTSCELAKALSLPGQLPPAYEGYCDYESIASPRKGRDIPPSACNKGLYFWTNDTTLPDPNNHVTLKSLIGTGSSFNLKAYLSFTDPITANPAKDNPLRDNPLHYNVCAVANSSCNKDKGGVDGRYWLNLRDPSGKEYQFEYELPFPGFGAPGDIAVDLNIPKGWKYRFHLENACYTNVEQGYQKQHFGKTATCWLKTIYHRVDNSGKKSFDECIPDGYDNCNYPRPDYVDLGESGEYWANYYKLGTNWEEEDASVCENLIPEPPEPPARGNPDVNLKDVDCTAPDGTCIAVGYDQRENSAYIYRSYDGGATWPENNKIKGKSLYKFKFVNVNNKRYGFTAGKGTYIGTTPPMYGSGDDTIGHYFGGQNVEKQYKRGPGNNYQGYSKPIYSLSISDSGVGYAGGQYATGSSFNPDKLGLWKTEHFGQDWYTVNDLANASSNRKVGWTIEDHKNVVENSAVIDISSNEDGDKLFAISTRARLIIKDGNTWRREIVFGNNTKEADNCNPNTLGRLEAVHEINGFNKVIVVGGNGCVAISENPYNPTPTWENVRPNVDHGRFNDVDVYGNTVVVVGDNGKILINKEQGEKNHWYTVKDIPSYLNLLAVRILDKNNAIIVGTEEAVIRTENLSVNNAAVSWQIIDPKKEISDPVSVDNASDPWYTPGKYPELETTNN